MDSFEISSDSYDPRTLRNSGNSERQENTTARQPQTQTKNTQRPPHAPSADSSAASKSTRTQTAGSGAAPQGRWRLFFGILLILTAVYLLIVSISFFSNGADDQSIVQGAAYGKVAESAAQVGNAGGPVGAVLSDLLMSRWLGLGSFIIIFYIGAIGVSLVKLHHFR